MCLKDFKELHWVSYDQERRKIKGLSNDHIINIIYHLEKTNDSYHFRNFLKLAKERGLTIDDFKRAQIPHLKNGEKYLMSYDKNDYLEVHKVV